MKRYVSLLLLIVSIFTLKAQNTKDFKFNAFKRIVLDFPAKVLIQYSPQYSIRVVDSSRSKTVMLLFDELDKNLDKSSISLENFSISERDSTLYITSHGDIPRNFKVSIVIRMPRLERIKIQTAASITITGKFNLPYFALNMEGASSIKIIGDPHIKHLSVKDEGASYVYFKLNNPIDYADLDIEGASLISALESPIRILSAKIEGASMCKVYPLEEMNIKVEGMSYVIYKGKPKKTHVRSEGLSIVKHVD